MATTTATRSTARPAIRARCDGCLTHIRALGERISVACYRLWRAIQALDALDDDLERQEIDEAAQAQGSFIQAVELASRDGRITPAERAALRVRAMAMQRELQDVRRYNDEIEDLQHQEARQSATSARETLAPVSQALNRAEEQAGPRHGGCEAPWADARI